MKKQITKYFVDTEFLEGTQKRRLGKIELPKMFDTKNTIDLISIGIVSEDNRELYLISKDFNLKEAWNRFDLKKEYPDDTEEGAVSRKVYWIRENVLKPIFIELWENEKGAKLTNADFNSGIFNYKHLKSLINKYGKTNEQIAEEVKHFVYGIKNIDAFPTKNEAIEKMNIQFYGYYSAYDHVTLCWLFGKMIDLPKGFPMLTHDIKQYMDLVAETKKYSDPTRNARSIAECLEDIKSNPRYPKETNSHHSLFDAKWNKKLYNFLNNI